VYVSREEPITLYVGKIAKGLGDDLIRKMLECCGKVTQWNRVTDPVSGELKAFGYAKFASLVDVLTAIRLLNGFELQGQNLLLKVGEKIQASLDTYEKEHPDSLDPEKEVSIRAQISALVTQFKEQILEGELDDDPTMKTVPSVAGDKEKASIVSEEIKKFRERQAQQEKEKEAQQKKVLSEYLESGKEKERRLEREVSRMRDERFRIVKREKRAQETQEREFFNYERHYEQRERDFIKHLERRDIRQKERQQARLSLIDKQLNSSETLRRHVKDPAQKRERQREFELDLLEKEKERKEAEALALQEQNRLSLDANPVKLELSKPVNIVPTKKRNRTALDILGDEEPSNEPKEKKKRVLIKLDYAEVGLLTDEDKKRNPELNEDVAKQIVQQIPVEKAELFAYPINWEVIEHGKIIEKKIGPWVRAKVVDYGDDDRTLEEFILHHVTTKRNPQQLLDDLQLAMGEETELFVKLLWRSIIFYMISSDANWGR